MLLCVLLAACWGTEIAANGGTQEALRARAIELTLLGLLVAVAATMSSMTERFSAIVEASFHSRMAELLYGAIRVFLFAGVLLQVLRWIEWLFRRKMRVEMVFAVSFAALIAAGAVALSLPGAATGNGGAIRPKEALFTAASAVCVTGLTVRDTGADFSTFGQTVLIGLMQAGGLGGCHAGCFCCEHITARFAGNSPGCRAECDSSRRACQAENPHRRHPGADSAVRAGWSNRALLFNAPSG